jgi:predicted TPR repeat methyltransferase
MYSQAAYCFGRALKIASYDPKIMVRRAEAFELAGQSKKAIATYKRLLEISQAPDYIKKYAKLRYRRGEYSSCR